MNSSSTIKTAIGSAGSSVKDLALSMIQGPKVSSTEKKDDKKDDEENSRFNPFATPVDKVSTSSPFALQSMMNLIGLNAMNPASAQRWSGLGSKSDPQFKSAGPVSGAESASRFTPGGFTNSGEYSSQGAFGVKSHALPTEFQGKIDPGLWKGVNAHLYNMFSDPKELAAKVSEYQGMAGPLANNPWILSTMIAQKASKTEIQAGHFNFMAGDQALVFKHGGNNSAALTELASNHGYNPDAVKANLQNKFGVADAYATSGRLLLATHQSDQVITNLSDWMKKFRAENGPDAVPKIAVSFYAVNDRNVDHNGVFTNGVRGMAEGQLTQLMINRGGFSKDGVNQLVFAVQGSQANLERQVKEVAAALHKEGIGSHDDPNKKYSANFVFVGHGSGQAIVLSNRTGTGDDSISYADLANAGGIGQHLNGASHVGVQGASCHSGEGLVQSLSRSIYEGIQSMGGNASTYSSGPHDLGWFDTATDAVNGHLAFLADGSPTFITQSTARNDVQDVILAKPTPAPQPQEQAKVSTAPVKKPEEKDV